MINSSTKAVEQSPGQPRWLKNQLSASVLFRLEIGISTPFFKTKSSFFNASIWYLLTRYERWHLKKLLSVSMSSKYAKFLDDNSREPLDKWI